MIRATRGLGAAVILALALAGCFGGDGDDGDHDGGGSEGSWWEELLAYVPAAQSERHVYLANFEEARKQLDVLAGDQRSCPELVGTLSRDEASAFADFTTILPTPDGLFASFPPDERDVIGFDRCQLATMASAGAPPDTMGVYTLTVDTAGVSNATGTRRYTLREHAEVPFVALGADYQPVTEGIGSAINRVLVEDAIVVRAPADPLIAAAIEAKHDDAAPRDDNAVAVLRALGDFHAAFVESQTIATAREVVLRLATLANEADPQASTDEVLATVAGQYADWGTLQRPVRVAYGYERTGDDKDVLKVSLLYAGKTEADAAKAELDKRLPSYQSLVTGEMFCTESSVEVVESDAGAIALASCQTRRPVDWLSVALGTDALFLVGQITQ